MARHPITPRENLDFGLDESIPRYWFDNDPFKTRFMEAIFVSFPVGERYFMTSVRHFRDQVTDPQLLADIKAFNRQEAQHGIVHDRFNDLLRRQGLPIDAIEGFISRRLYRMTKYCSPGFNLAMTAACEHITALMADAFYTNRELLLRVDRRVRAMLAWHAMEEMEHKAVAFDTMQKVARVGYGMRILTMLLLSVMFTFFRILDTHRFLKADGFGRRERLAMMGKGLWWAFGWNGVMTSMFRPWLAYFKPGFHPWQQAELPQYGQWLREYERTGDPIAAADALFLAA